MSMEEVLSYLTAAASASFTTILHYMYVYLYSSPPLAGEYVGLTGTRLDGAEMVACGLATHFVPADVCFQFLP